jgi:hypothetical protein
VSTPPSRTLTSGQLGDILHLSSATISRYVRLGRLPHDTTPGGHFRFNLAEARTALAATPGPSLDPDTLLADVHELTKSVVLLTLRVEAFAEQLRKKEA